MKQPYNNICEALFANTFSNRGITFLKGNDSEYFFSYKELYKNAQEVLAFLRYNKILPGNEIVFQITDNENFITLFWACLLGKIIPVPFNVANNYDNTLKVFRVWEVLGNPCLIFDNKKNFSRLEAFSAENNLGQIFKKIKEKKYLYKKLQHNNAAENIEKIKADDIAYIQFSSGSTGNPKGVIVTHKNVLTNVYDTAEALDLTGDDSFLSWKPLTHDFAMVAFHLAPIVLQAEMCLIPTEKFVWNPALWLTAISQRKATITASPNFGYRHFLKLLKKKRLKNESWDLSCLKCIINGGEPISVDLCEEFLDELKKYGLKKEALLPAYGLAEATLMVSSDPFRDYFTYYVLDRNNLDIGQKIRILDDKESPDAVKYANVGIPYSHVDLRITGTNGETLAECFVGTIELRGNSITGGYYRNPEATEKTINNEGWLDTGDIGFIINKGLVCVGRKKDIIFIHGVNYYPHDLELIILKETNQDELNKYIACGFFNDKTQKEEIIIFVYYKKDTAAFIPIVQNVKKILTLSMGIEVNEVIPVNRIPKTTSGKVQRFKLIEDYKKGKFDEKIKTISSLINRNEMEVIISQKNNEGFLSYIKNLIEKTADIKIDDFDTGFSEMGITSLMILRLKYALEENLGIEIPASFIIDFPTLNLIIKKLAKIVFGTEQKSHTLHSTNNKTGTDIDKNKIAIIGMGCRFPGEADTPDRYWNNLISGVDLSSPIPRMRWGGEDEIKVEAGYFLKNIDRFAASFFNITPTEALCLDPQQRLLLEVSWHALENAGINTENLKESDTGVFIGISNNEYGRLTGTGNYGLTGSMLNTASGRISYFFGFNGPAVSIDTACSSSLVAVHSACQSLILNDCNAALAGGVNLITGPVIYTQLQDYTALSPDGKCKTFDESANGYARGEGCGIIVLKRLADAERAGDNILAVIRSSAVNHDGKSSGLTVPNGRAQEKVILKALKKACMKPDDISYIETHGTGTKIGDPQEICALSNIFGRRKNKLILGAVKSSIGHLESAAGIAGLMKVVLSIKNEMIPAQLHLKKLNPLIPWDNIPVKASGTHTPWRKDGKSRAAGISSFGLSGTNAHIIIEAPPCPKTALKIPPAIDYHVLSISAKTEKNLHTLAANYKTYLSETHDRIEDICYTAYTGRTLFSYKLILTGNTKKTFIEKLNYYIKKNKFPENLKSKNDLKDFYHKSYFKKVILPSYPFSGGKFWIKNKQPLITTTIKPVKKTETPPPEAISPGKSIKLFNQKLNKIIQSVTGLNPDCTDEKADIFSLGIDSLMLTHLKNEVVKEFGINIIASERITELATLGKIREYVFRSVPDKEDLRMPDNLSTGQKWISKISKEEGPTNKTINNKLKDIPIIFPDYEEIYNNIEKLFKKDENEIILNTCSKLMNKLNDFSLHKIMKCLRKKWQSGIPEIEKIVPAYRLLFQKLTGLLERTENKAAQGNIEYDEENKPLIDLINHCSNNIVNILSGDIKYQDLLFFNVDETLEKIYKDIPMSRLCNTVIAELVKYLVENSCGKIRILEIGAGTGGTTKYLLPLLPRDNIDYCFTDLSSYFCNKAEEMFKSYRFMTYKRMDIGNSPLSQGFKEEEFDIIIAANVIHATSSIKESVQNMRQLLSKNGIIILLELTKSQPWMDTTFGLIPDWWNFTDSDLRLSTPLLSVNKWIETFKSIDLKNVSILPERDDTSSNFPLSIIVARRTRDFYVLSSSCPMSSPQRRLYAICQIPGGKIAYQNLLWNTFAISINEECTKEKITSIFKTIIMRHESLRTGFKEENGRFIQHIYNDVPFIINYREGNKDEIGEIISDFIKPFDLQKPPLIRVLFIKTGHGKLLIFFDTHHIAVDGRSLDIIFYEFFSLYHNKPLELIESQYKDYVLWEKNYFKSDQFSRDEGFWLNEFSGDLPAHSLPVDYPRPLAQDFKGALIRTELDDQKRNALEKMAKKTKTTLYMVLISCFYILLYKLSGENDIIVGASFSGRHDSSFKNTIGMFVNTFPLRNSMCGEKSYSAFLNELKKRMLEYYEHQKYPFEMLVNKLDIKRDISRTPIFDVVCSYINMEGEYFFGDNLNFNYYNMNPQIAIFDLTLNIIGNGNTLFIDFQYRKSLFKGETIKRWIDYFQRIMDIITARNDILIKDMEILLEPEKQKLTQFSKGKKIFHKKEHMIDLFEEQVRKYPERNAVVGKDILNSSTSSLSYSRLNKKTNKLARLLQQYGAGRGDIIAVMLPSSIQAIEIIYSVLKMGGTYLPVNSSLPAQRIKIMLDEAKVKIMVSVEGIGKTSNSNLKILLLEKIVEEAQKLPDTNLELNIPPGDLIYTIFTSGSTGTPKAAGVYHKGFSNLVQWFIKNFNITSEDSNLLITSLSFDLTQKNLFAPMLTGGTLYIPGSDYFDPAIVLESMTENRITWLNCTPGMFYQLVNHDIAKLAGLKYVFLGGEPISVKLLLPWLESGFCNAKIVNTYGPTECTDICASYVVDDYKEFITKTIPIGRPVYNVQLFVLDKYKKNVPAGITGELHIAGAGLGKGYINDRKLTDNKFIKITGKKMYATGDLVKWLPDGNLLFIGRIDNQVKIRGFRIEPGEVETVTNRHQAVSESVAIIKEKNRKDKELIIYVVPAKDLEANYLKPDKVAEWNEVWRQTYQDDMDVDDNTFNIKGWNSSYTGGPIPVDEMKEWLNTTIDRIKYFNPEKIFEIGIGTGMLLSKLAPVCDKYLGTDFSGEAVEYVKNSHKRKGTAYNHVELLQRSADNFSGITPGLYDLIIINSVIQYFPDVNYLISVITKASEIIKEGGVIFIGDVRNFPLHKTFMTSLWLYRANPGMTIHLLKEKISNSSLKEPELLVDPLFFYKLSESIPCITNVEIRYKQGNALNELTSYRYDVILYTGKIEKPDNLTTIKWDSGSTTPLGIKKILSENKPDILKVENIPNIRVNNDIRSVKLLSGGLNVNTVKELKKYIKKERLSGTNPGVFQSLHKEYFFEPLWQGPEKDGLFTGVFIHRNELKKKKLYAFSPKINREAYREEWKKYTNNTFYANIISSIISNIRSYLNNNLPEYMVPHYIIMLKQLPLNPNGKIDRKSLPSPENMLRETSEFCPPVDILEKRLVDIWEKILGIEGIGIHDNFFEIGGDSIKAIQVAAAARDYNYHIAIGTLFNHPTIHKIQQALKSESEIQNAVHISQDEVSGILPLTPVQQVFFRNNYKKMNLFNQSILLYRKEGIDKNILNKLFPSITAHHDIFRSTFYGNGSDVICQSIHKCDEGIHFNLKEFSIKNLPPDSLRDIIMEKALFMQQEIDLKKGPLLKAGLFRSSPGDYLVITAHYLIFDNISRQIFIEDFETGYKQLEQGEPVKLPAKTAGFNEWAGKIKNYLNRQEVRNEAGNWEKFLQDNPIAKAQDDSDRNKITIGFTKNETNVLTTDANIAYNTSTRDILLGGLGLALKEWKYGGKQQEECCTIIEIEENTRRKIIDNTDFTRTIGCFANRYPLIVNLPDSNDISHYIKDIKETLRGNPDRSKYKNTLTYPGPGFLGEANCEIGFHFHDESGTLKEDSFFTISPTSKEGLYCNGIERFYLLHISAIVIDDRLNITFNYAAEFYNKKKIIHLTKLFRQNIDSITAHCIGKERPEFTPSDYNIKSITLSELELIKNHIYNILDEGHNIEKLYRLSPMQEGMLFHSLYNNNPEMYCQQIALSLEGTFNAQIFKKAMKRLFDKYDVFRTIILYKSTDKPVQAVLTKREPEVYSEDISHYPREKQAAYIKKFKKQDTIRGFNLSGDVLFRVSILKTKNTHYKMIIHLHHIILDGWCMGIIFTDLFKMYDNITTNTMLDTNKGIPYERYINWLEGRNDSGSLEFWKNYLDGYEKTATLDINKQSGICDRTGRDRYEPEINSFSISKKTTDNLLAIAKNNAVTVNTIFQSLWGILLQKYNNTKDVVFGVVVSGRPAEIEDVEKIVGLFINTIPVRIRAGGDTTFSGLLKIVQQNTSTCKEHDCSSLVEIQSKTELNNNLFDNIMVFENIPLIEELSTLDTFRGKGFSIKDIRIFDQVNYNLSVSVMPAEKLVIIFNYNGLVYNKNDIERIKNHFINILNHIINNPGISIGKINVLSGKEKNTIISQFNCTTKPYNNSKTVVDLFKEQVLYTPDNIAVSGKILGEEIDNYGLASLTYKELHDKVDYTACILMKEGVKSGDVVAIMINRSIDMIIGILGILTAGAAYLPIDPEYPEKRINYIIEDSGISFLLTGNIDKYKLTGMKPVNIINISNIGMRVLTSSSSSFTPAIKPDNTAYIIYTSGSTGKPKGIMTTHKNLAGYIHSFLHEFPLTGKDTVIQQASFSFDTFIEEVFPVLSRGGKVVIPGKFDILDIKELIACINRHNVSLISCSPLLLNEINKYADEISTIHTYISGGDVLRWEYINKLINHANVYNTYGPTETTVCATYHKCSIDHTKNIPIGYPITNYKVYIMDKNSNLMPVGVTGEICISGIGVSKGYHNKPDLTKEKFIRAAPAGDEIIYKTGDAGKWLPCGTIEFSGRIDSQIKLRGFRIELGEIESRLLEHNNIAEAIVTTHGDENFLCAYYTLNGNINDQTVSERDLRDFLLEELPGYMVPSYFTRLDEIPVTLHGKVDKGALPEPDFFNNFAEFREPSTMIEKKLSKIWQKLLNLKKIGTSRSFFEIGGHSIKAISLVSQVEKMFGIKIPLSYFFKFSTIDDMAKYILNDSIPFVDFLDEAPLLLNNENNQKIFCFPPLAAYSVYYQRLADILDDYAVYSFGFIKAPGRISIYTDHIMDIQKNSPYKLFGYCSGANLAFEVAKEIEKRGGYVSDIIMFDSRRKIEKRIVNKHILKKFLDELELFINSKNEITGEIIEELKARARIYFCFFQDLVNNGTVNASIHIITSEGETNLKYGWDSATFLDYKIYNGEGAHISMLGYENMKKNGKLMKQILQQENKAFSQLV